MTGFHQRPQTARSAASGPVPVPAPGRGHPHRSWLASSRVVAAPPSALLASRVIVSAQVCRQLAGQPQGGRYRLWRRCRRWLGGLSCRRRGGPHWDHRLQPRSLGWRLLRLATAGDALHQLCGRHPGGVLGQMDPVAGPDANPPVSLIYCTCSPLIHVCLHSCPGLIDFFVPSCYTAFFLLLLQMDISLLPTLSLFLSPLGFPFPSISLPLCLSRTISPTPL